MNVGIWGVSWEATNYSGDAHFISGRYAPSFSFDAGFPA
jgi:hypothetical protein